MRATDGTISEVPTGWIGTSSDSAGASSAPQTTNPRYTTLAERLANNDGLRRNFTIGLKWWTPLSPLNGFIGVAEACSRLWENTVLLSALITSFSMYAVTFPIREIIDAGGHVPQTYAACWTLGTCSDCLPVQYTGCNAFTVQYSRTEYYRTNSMTPS